MRGSHACSTERIHPPRLVFDEIRERVNTEHAAFVKAHNADVLKEEQDVYKEVAEIAERMAQAISSSRGG